MFNLSKSLVRRFLIVSLAIGGLGMAVTAASAAEGSALPAQGWSFNGPFGTFDRGQLQRGFKVFKEVCSACHSMRLVPFRALAEEGGLEFTEEQVKALAAEYEVTDGPNDEGEMFQRPAKPSDRIPAPFANEQAARASNGGALPPDFSVIAKARRGGADYIHALLTGYEEPPAGVELREGMNYNTHFPGNQIAMAAPLSDEVVEYTDGTAQTADQYAKDVAAFLTWVAEPKLEARHRIGFQVLIYLVVLAGLMYATKKKLFASVDH